MSYFFYDDYSEGAHPKMWEALSATNLEQQKGYGEDRFCLQAAELIKQRFACPSADVHFASAGTQTNLTVLSSMLRSFEAVIAVDSAHIVVHEAGAVEANGHKILVVPSTQGKLTPERILEVCAIHNDEHMVKPRVAYISQSTEMGTVYTKQELEALSAVCKAHGLYLYVDGARLAAALASPGTDVTYADIARVADAFYIGGTKNGGLFGEAIVLVHPELKKDFRYYLKQRGALLAKGRMIGIQFETFFQEDLYLELARHANAMAEKLSVGIRACGYPFLVDSRTNILLPIFPNAVVDVLKTEFGFHPWQKMDEAQTCIRLVTSWATREDMVDAFLKKLAEVTSSSSSS